MHPSAQQDALTAARHRAFIAPRILGSIVALASFPVYLYVRGAPSVVELLVFAWLVVPILTAYFLSRTGRYESAHILSSLALTGLVTAVAASNGGIASFAAIWLVVVPLEAALSASRRVVAIASTFALGAAGCWLCSANSIFCRRRRRGARGTCGTWHRLGRRSMRPGSRSAPKRWRGPASGCSMPKRIVIGSWPAISSDVITRHGRDGAVLFVSPAAESLFGSRIAELQGHGLFERVHVADRPAYLTALGDAAALGEPFGGISRAAQQRRCRRPRHPGIRLDRDAVPAVRAGGWRRRQH